MKKIIVASLLCLLLSCACLCEEYDGYIVKLKQDFVSGSSSDLSLFGETDGRDEISLFSDEHDGVSVVSERLGLVKADDEDTLDTLVELGVVESYEKDILMELFDCDYTLNPLYSKLYYLDYINAQFAWDSGITGNNVKVGVIDSGVYPHTDIADNLLEGKSYDTSSSEDDTYDTVSHGTGVAGIIAAACNEISSVGIAFDAQIVPLKVTYKTSEGKVYVSTSYAVEALEDAVDVYECDVVNMSFGTDTKSSSLEEAVNYAMNNGVIVVAASGNYGNKVYGSGTVVNPPLYPAYYDGVIAVANAYVSGSTLAIKATSTYHDKIALAAPGTDIVMLSNTSSGYKTDSGTSFSSPMVAAAAALAKSVKPEIGQAEFKQLIMSTADSSYISTSGQSAEKWGAGLLDVEAMLLRLICDVSEPETVEGELCVYITNLSDSLSCENCAYIIEEYDESGKLIRFKVDTFSIGPSASLEISLSALGFTENAIVSVNYEYCPGDVNCDGKVNVLDASAILRYLAGYSPDISVLVADVDGNGTVNVLDASALLRYLAGYPVRLN